MVTVYGMKSSGNCYKVQLLLERLGRPYAWREVNILAGESRTPQYLAMNANGRVPLLDDAGRYLAESNAILTYLADGTPLLPDDRWTRAQVMQWLFFEQYSHEPYVAVARFIRTMLPRDTPRLAELPRLVERGNQALAVMERHLSARPYFVGDAYTIADIALYAYTHAAADGGFHLAAFPAVLAWLGRVRGQPRHVAMGAV